MEKLYKKLNKKSNKNTKSFITTVIIDIIMKKTYNDFKIYGLNA